MQTVKHATVIFLILLPVTLGLYLTFRQHEPPPVTPSAPTAPAARPYEAPAASDDPLVTLNTVFRSAYAASRKETLHRVGPVILVEGDNVVLWRKGERVELPFTPAVYHELKAVAHVPLAVYVQLAPYGDGPVSVERLTDLRKYRDLIGPARPSVEKRGFAPAVIERQRKILDGSTAFLDGVLERKEVKPGEVAVFTKQMGPLVMENAAEAARAQIDALHAQVMAWRKEMGPEGWKQVRVVVMGSHMPREGNLAMRYFTRVLDEPVDDRRLMYAESLWDEKKAMELLGTSVLDTRVGADFFGDELRMHRDLLDDAARAYVKQLTIQP